MTNEKITDKQLVKELENGKTYKEIAHEYGYGYPSRALSQKIRGNGYRKNNKASFYESGGVNLSIEPDKVEKALEVKGIDREKGPVYFSTEVSDDGDINVCLHRKEWRREE